VIFGKIVFMKKLSCFSAALFLFTAVFAQGPYSLLRKIPIGGEGGWDYLTADPAARRLYVSHAAQVEVLDLDAGKPVGKIDALSGVHGIAVASEFGRGFITNGKADIVTVFDLKTLQKLGEIKTGKKPDAITYDPVTQRVFAYNGDSGSATVIEASSGKVAGTIDLGGAPEFSVPDGNGNVYVNLEDKNVVLKIDAKKLAIDQRWPLAPCEEPSSMAIDKIHRRLFIGCANRRMVAVDADSGQGIASLPIGEHVDSGAYDPQTGLVFEACLDGTTTVIHEEVPDRFSVVQTLKTQRGSKNMALDESTHHLFLSAGEFEPPEVATAAHPGPRPKVKPGTFAVLEFSQR
jgi:DNA-binding beta-propeller fold protein YncE